MNNQNDHRRLLSDILSEDRDANLRDSLLVQTISLARRRRRQRQLLRAVSAVSLIACLGLLFWRAVPPKPAQVQRAPRPYSLIETRPLAPTSLVKTEPLDSALVITSVRTENIVSTITVRKTYQEIDEQQLFALAPAPLILIWHGAHSAEVVFADPADQKKFLRN